MQKRSKFTFVVVVVDSQIGGKRKVENTNIEKAVSAFVIRVVTIKIMVNDMIKNS
jgi:hypothetical protein